MRCNFISPLLALLVSGCLGIGGPQKAIEPSIEKWHVNKGQDPINDNKICRITGEPRIEYLMNSNFVSPFIEVFGKTINAGFTSGNPDGTVSPRAPRLMSIEYRFDGDQAEKIVGGPAPAILISSGKYIDFINKISTRSKLTYRINSSAVVEYHLSDISKELSECGINIEELSTLDKQGVNSGVEPQENQKATKFGVAIKGLPTHVATAMKLYAPMMQAYGAQIGVSVVAVEPDTPAAKAGIMAGDMLIEFNGSAVLEPEDVVRLVAAVKPGSMVPFKIRRSGAVISLNAKM